MTPLPAAISALDMDPLDLLRALAGVMNRESRAGKQTRRQTSG